MASGELFIHTLDWNYLPNVSGYAFEAGKHEQVVNTTGLESENGNSLVDIMLLRQPLQPYQRLCFVACGVLVLLCVTYVRSTLMFKNTMRTHVPGKLPPTIPYWLPFLCHIVPLAWNPANFVASIVKQYGYRSPLEIRAGLLDFTLISNPEHIQFVFKSSKWLSSKPATLFSLKKILAAPKRVIPFYAADDSGMAAHPRKGSTTKQEDRIHFWQASTAQKYLSGQTLLQISERYLGILTRNLDILDIQNDWVDLPDLYNFLQMEVSRAAIESMMGSCILELNPTLVEDFWKFDSNVPNYIRGFPRWLIPSAYKARDRLLASVKKWHAYANEHSDCSKLGPEDPEWDPYFGTKLVKARQNYALKMKPMDADARASEDMGLLFAANANAVPSIFWYLFETLKDSSLQARMWAEARTCKTEDGGFDITRLSNKPLLQSAYAEVLRLRVAITMTRTDEFGDFNLAGYIIPRHKPIVIFSRTAALNEEAWTLAGRPPARPLKEFYADRFLVYPDAASERAGTKENTSAFSTEPPLEAVKEENPKLSGAQFSLDGLAGCWLPYGGGQRMCPGRHFAKNEIIGTFALLFSKYEIELTNADNSKVQPDMRWYPVGGLPPVCKVPFRIRKRQGS